MIVATDPNARDSPSDVRNVKASLTGWKHLQRALGRSLHNDVKRSRKLSAAILRRKGK